MAKKRKASSSRSTATPKLLPFSYTFHRVGQGLFASGLILGGIASSGRFNWVYDCGSASAKGHLAAAISDYRSRFTSPKPPKRPDLDLVAISHFDNDHVNGFKDLLIWFNVGTVMLPYVPLAHRLAIAFEAGVSTATPAMDFAIDPVKAVHTHAQGDVDRIILVTAEADTLEDREPLPFDDTDALSEVSASLVSRQVDGEDFRDLQDSSTTAGAKLIFLPNALPLSIGAVWELLPYNDARLASIPTPAFIKAVALARKDLRSTSQSVVDTAVKSLKARYAKAFAGKKARNQISLFLYGGPLDDKAVGRLMYYRQSGPRSAMGARVLMGGLASAVPQPSILYTGDGYLKNPAELDALKLALTPRRVSSIGVLQAPHHGSEANWHAAVATDLSPLLSVFSSDPLRPKLFHPDAKVVRDLWCYGPMQVDQKLGLSVDGEIMTIR